MSTAKRYNLAYNYVFNKKPDWMKELIIKGEGDNYRRVWEAFIVEVTRLAESDREIEIVKSNYKELKEKLVTSGTNE
jgi:beta-mannanase